VIKRGFDFLGASFFVILLSPFILFIFFLVKLFSKGPGFFKQERVGKNGKLFEIFKFRTMHVAQASNSLSLTLHNDDRVFPLGRGLRRYKIDEIPQLFNILKGEMSFVGPRPEVEKYFQYYTQEEKEKILSIVPGITDLASLRFRNESELLLKTDNPEKIYIEKILPIKKRYYKFYVEKRSFLYDMHIIFQTIRYVFFKKS
jgi:lipopolysaccharide/colanic/teichoic acid biosynthesis glycosyltransferase